VLDWYFEHRFGSADAQAMREISAISCSNFRQWVTPMRIPTVHNKAGLSDAEIHQRGDLIDAVGKMSALKNRQGSSTAYKGELLDFGRMALHTISRADLFEAIGIAANSTGSEKDKQAFEASAKQAIDSLTALADLLATDQRYCVRDTLYRMLNEPGVNRQMRQVLLEHASGRLFNNYALNDSAEFIRFVSVPLLEAYLESMRLSVNNPAQYPFAKIKEVEFIDGAAVLRKEKAKVPDGQLPPSTGLDKRLLELKNDFMELPALPFKEVGNPSHPADVLNDWLKGRN